MPEQLTTAEFVSRAKDKHKDRYGYEFVQYYGMRIRVTIRCCVCESYFSQNPVEHLAGHGCPFCNKKYAKDTNQFVREAIQKHGQRYDYSQVEYANNRSKVQIKCNYCQHCFWQAPKEHLKGKGCHKCGGTTRSTAAEFIAAANRLHGQRFNYEQVVYRNSKTHVTVGCQDCNRTFKITPNSHLRGDGCSHCSKTRRKTINEFVAIATSMYGQSFDYSQVKYVNGKTKVAIICTICGYRFMQTPQSHLKQKRSCVGCSRRVVNTETFVEKAVQIHGNDYDYSCTVYTDSSSKLQIRCNACGVNFWQKANGHMNGKGCNKCATTRKMSAGERRIREWLEQHGIRYQPQWRHKELGRMRFDFYLPAHRLLIEYDGEQHFKAVPSWGGEEALASNQKRDQDKSEFARAKGIKLLRIPFTEKQRIPELLSTTIEHPKT